MAKGISLRRPNRRAMLWNVARTVALSILGGQFAAQALAADPAAVEPDVAFTHLPICVSDIERSLRFYCEALGFTKGRDGKLSGNMATLLEVSGMVAKLQFVHLGTLNIELLQFEVPGATGPTTRRPMNQLGITNLALKVADLDRVAGRIRKHGGAVIESTRITVGSGGQQSTFMTCTDPDGIRLVLRA